MAAASGLAADCTLVAKDLTQRATDVQELPAMLMQVAARLRRGGWRSRYRLRKRTAEPVIGQIQGARGFRQFVLRGGGLRRFARS